MMFTKVNILLPYYNATLEKYAYYNAGMHIGRYTTLFGDRLLLRDSRISLKYNAQNILAWECNI